MTTEGGDDRPVVMWSAALGAPGPAGPRVEQILHPSPASPAANRGWEPAVDQQLERLGVFAN